MKWQDKLNKTELKHLRDMGITTFTQAKRNAAHQAVERVKNPDTMFEPCWDCKNINMKLGLPV